MREALSDSSEFVSTAADRPSPSHPRPRIERLSQPMTQSHYQEVVLGLRRQRRLQQGDVAEVAGGRRLGPVGHVGGGLEPERGLVPGRLDLVKVRAARGRRPQDPAREALAAAAADVGHALAKASVQCKEERRVDEGVHVSDVQGHLEFNVIFAILIACSSASKACTRDSGPIRRPLYFCSF
jgi:hypothetical protein